MKLTSRFRELSKLGKAAVIVAASFALYAILTGLVLPPILKSQLEIGLHEQLHRKASIGSIRFNPFAVALSVEDFNLDDSEDGTFVSFARLHLNVDPLTSIIKRAVYVKEASLTEPGVRIRVLENGEFNFADLMNEEDPEPEEPDNADSGELPTVLIGNVAIENGRIEFLDDSKTDPFRVEIVPLNISASGFGTHSHTASPYQIGAAIKDGATLRWNGDFSVEPLLSHGTLELESLRLTRLWSYLADLLNFQILAGTASLNAQYTFDSSGDDVLLTIEDGTLTTDGVEIGAKGATNPDLTLPSFAVRDIAYDLTTNSVTISEIESADGRIGIVISEDGIVNIQPLFAASADNAPEATEQAAAPQADATVEESTPLKIAIDSIDIHDYAVSIDDASGPEPATLDLSPIAIGLQKFSLEPGAQSAFNVSVGIQETGTLTAKGNIGLDPLAVETELSGAQLPLAAFSPYVSRSVNLSITGGVADLQASIAYALEAGDPQLSLNDTKIEVRDLATTSNQAPLVGWKSLAIGGLALDPNANRLTIDDIQLADPTTTVEIDREGRLNYSRLPVTADSSQADAEVEVAVEATVAATEAVVETEETAQAEAFAFEIAEIRVSDGAFTISDASVEPNFAMDVSNFQATVNDLTTDESKISHISASATLDKTGTVTFDAKLNPLAETVNGELKLRMNGVGMRSFSSYSDQAIDHTLSEGQIGAELDFTVKDNRFDAQNRIDLDHLSVKRSTRPGSSSLLPLGLAVALMKDSKGHVNVDLPIHGDFNDPEYSFGKPLTDAIVNLVTKTAASPFGLMGKLAGFAGDDLGEIKFAPGVPTFDGLQAQKLEAIGTILLERERLILLIPGPSNPELDRPGLAARNVERKLQSVRFEELKRKGKGPQEAEDVVVTAKDRYRILAGLYEDAFDESARALEKKLKEKGKIGKKDDEDEIVENAMVKRLAESSLPTDAEIRELAEKRAAGMWDHLVGIEGLSETRLQLSEPNLDAKASDGRVLAKLDLTTE